jgi:cardiolipin synthase
VGRFRAKDMLLPPSLLSLLRVPLAITFPLVVRHGAAALLVLAAAGVSDVLDGWLARRTHRTTPTGAVLDPVTDKLFVLAVVVTLVGTRQLSLLGVLLLSTREVGELPLVFWFLVSHRVRRARATKAAANLPGKAVTSLQFATIAALLVHARFLQALLFATGGAGLVAALAYWTREIGAFRAHTRSEEAGG